MSEILALSLRPRSLSELYGQESTVAAIRKHKSTRMPSTWMFTGPSGSGKTTIAKILSIAFQCQHMKLWGDPCEACQKGSWAVHEINASGEDRGVSEIAKVAELSRYKPANPNGKRVIILDEAHGLSTSAWRLLLKPLEEPAPATVWIICTTDPNKIPITARRRCTIYQLKTLGISAAEDFLKKQAARVGITRPLGELLEQCHLMGIGAPALLLQALEKYAAGVSAAEAVSGVDESGVDSLRICRAVTAGNWKLVAENLSNATPEHARYIRASVSGWLMGCLKKENNPKGQQRHALSLVELSQFPFDDTAMLAWLFGTLWKVTQRYGGGTQ